MTNEDCRSRLALAARWLVEIAQVTDETHVTAAQRAKHRQLSWTGAIRGEYRVATRSWGFYCPAWHTGQAVTALIQAAARFPGTREESSFMDGARRAGEFLMANRVTEGPDRGLLLAFEDFPDRINISAILESVDGLARAGTAVGEARYVEAALEAVEWVRSHALIGDTGLVRDLYDPRTREFVPSAFGTEGRPLMDDGAFLTAWRIGGRAENLEAAVCIADRLCADEEPEGNWARYAPCDPATGTLHPRHAYWWGRPLLELSRQTGEGRYRELFLRACRWYRGALRRDGGMFRGTYADFTTDSFGHAASGTACGVLMFLDALAETGDCSWQSSIDLGLSWCMLMQFTRPRDSALRGCILEKVLPPDGTDDNPYHVRDLGTTFFAQAAAQYLAASPGS